MKKSRFTETQILAILKEGEAGIKVKDICHTSEIVCQDWCHLLPDDTPHTLWWRSLAPMGVPLITQGVSCLVRDGTLPTIRQDERCATWEPVLARERLNNTA